MSKIVEQEFSGLITPAVVAPTPSEDASAPIDDAQPPSRFPTIEQDDNEDPRWPAG